MKNQDPEKCANLQECNICSRQIIFWSLGANIFLAVIKLLGGILSKSSGLMADGLQSTSCIIGTALIMYSMTISQRKPDEKFPYGYGKAEFIASLVVFSILVGLGFFISLSSLLLILQRNFEAPDIRGLPVATISIVLNYMIYQYSSCAGNSMNNNSLIANAYQSKADMFSSIAVCLGILLSQFGKAFGIFDPLAAFLVGGLILKDAFHHWSLNLKVVLDKAPEPGYREDVCNIVSALHPEKSDCMVKLKRTGRKFWVGITMDFSDSYSLSEVESIKRNIEKELYGKVPWVGGVDFFLEVS